MMVVVSGVYMISTFRGREFFLNFDDLQFFEDPLVITLWQSELRCISSG